MIENQLSTKFKGVFLGFSKIYQINDSGCLVACISRVLQLPLLEVHQKLKDRGCFFNEALLDLTKVPRAFPQLTYTGKFAYDNNIALEAIKRNGIVIAEVDHNPIMNGTQQHFVCMVGDGKIEDSLGGKIKPVSTYKTYLTLRVFEIKPMVTTTTTINQEEENILKFLKGKTEGDVREAFGYLGDKAKHDEQMATLSQKVLELDKFTKTLQEKIDILDSEVTASNEIILKWQNEAQSAKEQASKAIAQINSANEEKNKYRRLYEGLLATTPDKMTIIQLFKLIIKKLQNK